MRRVSRPLLALALAMSAALFVLSGGPARAQDVTGAEIIEYGMYERGQLLGEFAPPNRGYRREAVAGFTHLETATIIPGRQGITFGIHYRLTGEPMGAPVPVTVVIRFPEQGLLSPSAPDDPIIFDSYETMVPLGLATTSAHTFDYLWEIEPGIWVFEIWSGGEKLAEQQFEVITPPIS
jgi:hypothetical protein